MGTESTRNLSEAPIYILLNGDLYSDASKTMVGSIIGDTRLVALDAFLDSLSNTNEFADDIGNCSMSTALRQMVEKCHPKLLANSEVVMEITSKLNLERNEMTHVFRIRAQAKKK